MAAPRLTTSEAAALQGALLVPNDELAAALADCVERAAISPVGDDWIEDLRELAAVALVTARRLEAASRR